MGCKNRRVLVAVVENEKGLFMLKRVVRLLPERHEKVKGFL